MTPREYLEILTRAAALKKTPRHCWTEPDRRESVADHSWRLALMAMLLSGEPAFQGIDMNKVIRMCLIHDLGEAFTGDIPSFEKTEGDTQREDAQFLNWVKTFPPAQKKEWSALLEEMAERRTPEAKTYKALDQLEAVISHNESDLSTWLPLEYTLQFIYGKDTAEFSPYLIQLHQAVDQWTEEKIKGNKPQET